MTRRWPSDALTPALTGVLTDTGVAGLLLGAMVTEALLRDDGTGDLGVAACAAMVLVVLPTYARHRHPGWALAACMTALYLVLRLVDVHNTAPFSAMLCGYCLALVVDRRRTVLTGVLLVPAVAFLLLDFKHDPGALYGEVPKNLAYIAIPLLLGAAIRNRRDYLAVLVDRAETAERTREEEAARRVSEERLRIARDVHDVVSHAMVAINVQAGVGLHLLDRDPTDLSAPRRTLADIKQASDEALADLRATLGVLRAEESSAEVPVQAPVQPAQGLGDLPDLVAGLRSAGVVVDLEVDPAALGVPAGVATTGYRIVQEALTNVVRHAGGGAARVDVCREDGRVVIEVDDDGPVGDHRPVAAGTGHGVRGMRERAAAVGGTVDAGPHGTGWRVRAVLPVLPVLPVHAS